MGQYGKPIMDTSKMSAAQRRRRARERNGISVDPACVELARHFLSDLSEKPGDAIAIAEKALAEAIQLCVEDFIADTFEEPSP